MTTHRTIFLLSDTHFGTGPHEPHRLELLQQFTDRVIEQGSALYLLGDIFDFWIEYGSTIRPEYLPVCAQLERITAARIPVFMIRGNHEFMRGSYLQKKVGITILPPEYTLEVEGKLILLLHGHTIAPRFLFSVAHAVLSNPFFQWLYLRLPSRWGISFATWVSAQSRLKEGGHGTCSWESLARYHAAVVARGVREGLHAVVMGHTHHAEIKEGTRGVIYANGGTWMIAPTYLTLDEVGTFSLHKLEA